MKKNNQEKILYYKYNTKYYQFELFEIRNNKYILLDRFDDRSDILIYIEEHYGKAILIVEE